MKNLLVLAILALSLTFPESFAQCALIPIELNERISSSDLIVEASIVRQQSFRDPSSQNIYTANYLQIYKVFKGDITSEEVVLISPGGQVGEDIEEVLPSIYVKDGVTGIFFLYNSNVVGDDNLSNYRPFSGPQACIYYDKYDKTANDVFMVYDDIEALHAIINEYTGTSPKKIKKLDYFVSFSGKSATPAIIDITPDTTAAGIKHEISIIGTDFGAIQGAGDIEFRNASTGPQWVNPQSSQINLWSDTLIIVETPSTAGTGAVRVIQSGTAVILGPKVLYAKLNYNTFTKVLSPFHKDLNGTGGITWRMSTDYDATTGAKNSFIRAMNTWRDNTCINWENGPVTTVNKDQPDGINIVRFADPGELEQGVLGITRPRYKDCSGSVSYVNELDLSYNPSVSWHMGTSPVSPGSYDMESVIVHELGHAHILGHVIDEGDFMHATIGPGSQKRNLVNNNIDAGLFVMKYSVQTFVCGPDPMVELSGCNIPAGVIDNNDSEDFKVYPNPFSSLLVFSNSSNNSVRIKAFNSLGVEMTSFIVGPKFESHHFSVPENWSNGLYLFINADTGKVLSTNLLHR